MGSYQVEIARSVSKDFRAIDKQWIPKILEVIEGLAIEPRPSGCKKLVGSEHTYRIRVGDYRVVYEINDGTLVILVIRVRHRRDAYR
jgi:mRNA interferase RelE/StbE